MPAALPVRTLLLARRVRVLVLTTLVLTTATTVAGWADGGGVTVPGVAGFAAHLAVQAAVALPVHWQFAGDPARRERRAVRAMTVAFAVLAVVALVDAARTLAVVRAAAGGTGARSAIGLVLALAALVVLPVIAASWAREGRGARAGEERAPATVPTAVLVAGEALLVLGVGGHLVLGPGPAAATVWLVVGAVAAAHAVQAWRADGLATPATASGTGRPAGRSG